MGESDALSAERAHTLPAYRRAARTVSCPFCHAAAGQPCRTGAGRATYEHRDRSETTRRAQSVGYEEGLTDALMLLDWKAVEGIDAARAVIAEQRSMVVRSNLRDEEADRA